MDGTQIAMFAFQTIITVMIGAVGWGIKNAIDELKNANKDNKTEIAEVKRDLADLKSDLPLVYVLREDFIRIMNNVDTKLDKIISNNSHNSNGNTKEG